MSFEQFLESFVSEVAQKSRLTKLASWILETTGSRDAAVLKADLEIELSLLFNDKATFDKLVAWDKDPVITDPLLKRQLNVLIRSFKPNLIAKELLEKISRAESELSLIYSNYRPTVRGKPLSENEIREVLKNENDVAKRKEVWDASKQIGKELAPKILDLVRLRNQSAKSLGYPDYFTMQLELQEIEEEDLLSTFEKLSQDSEEAYLRVLKEINQSAAQRFHVAEEAIGPWAWSEPFCQEDPLDSRELDTLLNEVDIVQTCAHFYKKMGLDVAQVLSRSDNYERPGKNQHAFCIHIDREGDVRVLNNVKPSIKWLETMLHELGHAVYDLGYDSKMPWLLKDPPHMITTEAMALLAGRQAYRTAPLDLLVGKEQKELKQKAEISLKRRQLIFSRWVFVMTAFERELYKNPEQDLNALWWSLVKKHQKIECSGSSSGCDWAAKYHIGLAPVYYFSYLLGELFASSLEESIGEFASEKTGAFLNEKLFRPANSMPWNALVEHSTGNPLSPKAWLKEFC